MEALPVVASLPSPKQTATPPAVVAPLSVSTAALRMAPMTKEAYEKERNIVRQVFDEEAGPF